MARSLSGERPNPDDVGRGIREKNEATVTETARPFETNFTEAGSAAVAALLHLLRLACAELVVGRPGREVTQLEQSVRAKIEQFSSPTPNPQARDAGLAHARHLVEQVLMQIRAQAELKKSLTATGSSGTDLRSPASISKLLN
jgi:hypothetical protein